MSKTFHLSLDVRGLLGWPDAELRRLICGDDCKPASGFEARSWLLDHLRGGRRVLPIGEPCDGFSYETGCPGHTSVAPHSSLTGEG